MLVLNAHNGSTYISEMKDIFSDEYVKGKIKIYLLMKVLKGDTSRGIKIIVILARLKLFKTLKYLLNRI